jgi:lactate permease
LTLATLLLAILPLLVAILMLAVLQRSGLQSGLATMLMAILVVQLIPAFHLSIVATALAVATGVGTSLTVLYVLLPALLLYQVQRATGSIEVLVSNIGRLCPDQDVQLLLLILGVAPFVESVSGFGVGTVVIIPMLLALGLETLQAAVLGLFGQIAVPWGALAVGTVLGAQLTGLNPNLLGAQTALIMAPIPAGFALLALALAGRPGALRRLWPIAVLAGLLLVAGEWLFSQLIGIELVGPFATLPVILLLTLYRRGVSWPRPRPTQPSAAGKPRMGPAHTPTEKVPEEATPGESFVLAVAPYGILTLLLLLSRFVEPLQRWLETTGVLSIPALSLQFQLLYSPGFFILLTVFATAVLTRADKTILSEALLRTLRQFTPGAIAIVSFLAASQVMRAGGMIDVLGTAAASLGGGYSWIAPWLGALGGWLTGSNAGGNAVFAQLQRTASLRAHLPVNWVMTAQNGAGSLVTMASPARVVLAATATGLVGKEGQILRKVAPAVLVAITAIMVALLLIVIW